VIKILVIIPTFNEVENIGPLTEKLLRHPLDLEVLVVDDNSPDGTGARVQSLAGQDPRIHLIERSGKLGMGSAHREGLRFGLAHGYDRVMIMDGDFSHDPALVPEMIRASETADFVAGSRYVPGGSTPDWPWHRRFLSRGSNVLSRLVLGRQLHDWTSSYRCFRREALAALPLDRFQSDGYAFVEELAFAVVRRGFRVAEVPITFLDRSRGQSKINRHEVGKAVWNLLRLGLRRLFLKS